MVRRIGVAALVATGCSEPTCDFEKFVAARVDSAGLESCGFVDAYFGGPRDDASWIAAQACVQTHIDQHIPFVVRFQSPIIDYGTYLTIYAGREIDGVWTVSMLTKGTTSDFKTYATQWSCSDLQAPYPDCGPETGLYDSLCFKCVDFVNADSCPVDDSN